MMKKSKNKGRLQQQSGRPVLVAFYVIQPRRVPSGGTGATSSHDEVRHNRDHHHHLHGGGGYDERRRRNGGKFPNNRRADLLEYSRQLRALARHTTTSTVAAPTPPPCQPEGPVAATRRQPAAVNRRLKRAMSQQQIRQRCCSGSDGWSWKRVVAFMVPVRSNSHSVVGRTKPSRATTRMDGDDSERKRNNNQKSWPTTLLVGKLTVAKKRRDGFAKKLVSIFQKRSMDH